MQYRRFEPAELTRHLEQILKALYELEESDDDFAICLDRALVVTVPFLEVLRQPRDRKAYTTLAEVEAVQEGLVRIERLRWSSLYNLDNAQRATAIALRQIANAFLALRDDLETGRHRSTWRLV
jgi:hypothetical protein